MIHKLFSRGLAAAAILLALPGTAQAQLARQALRAPTAAELGAPPSLTAPVVSPNGKRVAARGLLLGKPTILIIDIATRAMTQVTIPEKNRVESLRWAGNDRILVSLSNISVILGQEVRITRLASMDLKTGAQVFVGPKKQGLVGDNLIFVDPAGAYALLSTQQNIFQPPAVHRVDLVTGEAELVVQWRRGVWDWYADSAGAVRAGIVADGERWWLLYRSGATGEFTRTATFDPAKNAKQGKKDNGIQQVVAIPGSDLGFAVADGKNGRLAVYRYDFKAAQLGDLLYENPAYDVDDFDLARDGSLRAIYYTADRAEVSWLDPDLKRLQVRIDRALPDTINRIISVSADKNVMLVWGGAANDPGAYYVYDRTANTMSLLAETHQLLADKMLSPMEPVRYAARDGLEIRAYLTLPAGRAGKDLPLIVMPHGGPFARDSWGFDPWVQYLAGKGYAVLQPNFRGSVGFGRDFVEKGVGQWGRGMQDDVDDGVKWLAARGTIDPKRVCIMGASFGGYAAMWAAVRNPDLYRCAISFAGISDVDAMLKYDSKSFSAPRYFRDWRERVQGDRHFELDQISPIKAVDRMTVPILIAHGEDDNNVPVAQSKRLHDALAKRHRPHEYVVYPDEGHGLEDPRHATDFLNRVGAFLDKYNPADR